MFHLGHVGNIFDDELKVFLVTATPVIHSGKFHFHFDSDALLLGLRNICK